MERRGGPIASVELLLDPTGEAAIRAEWARLAALGASSLAAHPSPTNRPHVTLLVRTRTAPFAIDAARSMLPLSVTLGAPMLFGAGERRVLVRSVVPSRDLLALQSVVHDAAGAADDIIEHTRPGRWTPHVTLARRIRVAQLGDALASVTGEIRTGGVALRHWDAATRTETALVGDGA